MAKRESGLLAVLNETTETVRKTDFDRFLHYSSERDGWQVKLGSDQSGRWKDAGAPKPLVDALGDALKVLVAQFAQNEQKRDAADRRRTAKRR